MRRRPLLTLVVLILAAAGLLVGGADAEPPANTSCTESPTAIRATGAAPGSAQKTDGTEGDDTIFGTSGNDIIAALGGADCLDGSGGSDGLDGGAGNDVLIAGTPAPGSRGTQLRGGAGDDRLIGVEGDEEADGGEGSDSIQTGAGNDQIFDSGDQRADEEDRVDAGPGNDTIAVNHGPDAITAGEGDDMISAANGAMDAIDCGAGTDRVEADFNDTLSGCERGAPRNAVRSVSPRVGRRTTRFRVRFRRPLTVADDNSTIFSIRVTPPPGTPCERSRPVEVWETSQQRLGRRLRSARLRPPGRRWCRGAYTGELYESFSSPSSNCDSGDAKPGDCSGDAIIGRFRLRVR